MSTQTDLFTATPLDGLEPWQRQHAVLTATHAFVDWMNDPAGADETDRHGGFRIPPGYRFSVDTPGKRFVRIVMHTPGDSRSVHAFVDLNNGDLLKAAGWKAPAKDARGNLVTDLQDAMDRFTWSGGYLYKDRS